MSIPRHPTRRPCRRSIRCRSCKGAQSWESSLSISSSPSTGCTRRRAAPTRIARAASSSAAGRAPYFDDESGESIGAGIDRLDALLLGRKTYDIFAAYWPTRRRTIPIAAKFNAVPKFVASRTLTDAVLGRNDGADGCRDRGPRRSATGFDEIHVIGSGDLVQTLLEEHLVDRLNLWVYPITFGTGKRLCDRPHSCRPRSRSSSRRKVFPKGAISLVYEPAGEPVTGVDIADLEAERPES